MFHSSRSNLIYGKCITSKEIFSSSEFASLDRDSMRCKQLFVLNLIFPKWTSKDVQHLNFQQIASEYRMCTVSGFHNPVVWISALKCKYSHPLLFCTCMCMCTVLDPGANGGSSGFTGV